MNTLPSYLRGCVRMLMTLCLCAGAAAYACTPQETGGTLTSVSSQRVSSGPAITGSGVFSVTCSTTVLSLLAGTPTMTAKLQASVTGLTLKNGGVSIPYEIFSNAGYSTSYSGGAIVVSLSGATLLSLLNVGSSSTTLPIYISVTPGPNVPAGTYTDTVSVTWTLQNICEGGVNIAGLCLGTLNNATVTRPMTISMTVTNDCTITAPAVSFGSAPLLSGFGTVSQNISLLCSKNMSYTVGMSAGGYSAGGRRRMATGGLRLEYDIFKADNSVWGSAGTARANGPAVADGVSQQVIPYTARIYQDQGAPAAGSYTDSVVVDVSF